ncbi:TPA: M48 family peptidase, partial [Candidatus Poribacteria bacterium]|nr:M48 family peptidase [Candidatus Poribacteria bacterium]
MEIYLSIIIVALVGEYLIRCVTRYFNLKAMTPDLPAEFDGFYDQEQYRKSQQYTHANTKFAYVSSSVGLIV